MKLLVLEHFLCAVTSAWERLLTVVSRTIFMFIEPCAMLSYDFLSPFFLNVQYLQRIFKVAKRHALVVSFIDIAIVPLTFRPFEIVNLLFLNSVL